MEAGGSCGGAGGGVGVRGDRGLAICGECVRRRGGAVRVYGDSTLGTRRCGDQWIGGSCELCDNTWAGPGDLGVVR